MGALWTAGDFIANNANADPPVRPALKQTSPLLPIFILPLVRELAIVVALPPTLFRCDVVTLLFLMQLIADTALFLVVFAVVLCPALALLIVAARVAALADSVAAIPVCQCVWF